MAFLSSLSLWLCGACPVPCLPCPQSLLSSSCEKPKALGFLVEVSRDLPQKRKGKGRRIREWGKRQQYESLKASRYYMGPKYHSMD